MGVEMLCRNHGRSLLAFLMSNLYALALAVAVAGAAPAAGISAGRAHCWLFGGEGPIPGGHCQFRRFVWAFRVKVCPGQCKKFVPGGRFQVPRLYIAQALNSKPETASKPSRGWWERGSESCPSLLD